MTININYIMGFKGLTAALKGHYHEHHVKKSKAKPKNIYINGNLKIMVQFC